MFTSKTELIYSEDVSTNKYNFLFVNDSFLQALDQQGQIIIQGMMEDIQDNKMMILNFMENPNHFNQQMLMNLSGQILREGNNFLKVENREPETHQIFDTLKEKQVTYQQIINKNIKQLINLYGIDLNTLCASFKISPHQFSQFALKAHYLEHNGHYLMISRKTYNQIFHIVYTSLTSQSLSLQNINLQTIYNSIFPLGQIDFTIYELACQLYLQNDEGIYRVSMSNVIRYILSQMGEIKDEYIKTQFDKVFEEMLTLYTPVNLKKPTQFPEIAQCFLYVKQHEQMHYYRQLSLPTTIKQLISHISNIKKKYTIPQIKGLMGHIFPNNKLQQALIKYFRKFGDQYQLKSLIVS